MTKKHGTVGFWSVPRGFGFLISKTDNNLIEKFFAHSSRVTICELDPNEIRPGLIVRFNIDPTSPRREGDCRYAIDIEVYRSEASAAVADLAASASNAEVA